MGSTYNTKQKQLILNLLSENSDSSFTCDEIEELLKDKGTPVGKSTVYRYLIRLQGEGRVRKFNENGKSAIFRYIEDKDECKGHMHLQCVECGDFIHLSCALMDEVSGHLMRDHDFTIDNSKTVLYGLCGICSKVKG